MLARDNFRPSNIDRQSNFHTLLPAYKAKKFQVLLDKLIAKYGSCKQVGVHLTELSVQVLYQIRQGKISERSARKLLTGYNRLMLNKKVRNS